MTSSGWKCESFQTKSVFSFLSEVVEKESFDILIDLLTIHERICLTTKLLSKCNDQEEKVALTDVVLSPHKKFQQKSIEDFYNDIYCDMSSRNKLPPLDALERGLSH